MHCEEMANDVAAEVLKSQPGQARDEFGLEEDFVVVLLAEFVTFVVFLMWKSGTKRLAG